MPQGVPLQERKIHVGRQLTLFLAARDCVAAFGTRADKLAVCKLHRVAWRTNLDLVKPLCLRVAPPRPDKQRARGDRAACDFCKERKRELDAEGLLTQQQVNADALMEQAVLGA